MCDSSRPRGSEMICLQDRQTRFSSSMLLARAASCKDFRLLFVDISVAFMHARTDEEIYVKVPSGIKSSRFWRLKAVVNGTRKASKHWQQFSCDKLVTNMLFQQNDINPCIYKRFCDNLDLEQHGVDFLVCGTTSNLEVLADVFKNNFLVKKAEILSLKPEHENEIHFLKRRIRVDNFGWHVELDQRYVKSLLDAMAMNHCKSMATPGPKGQESSRNVTHLTENVGSAGTSRVPIRCWDLSVYDRTTLRHCLQYEGNHERGSWTVHSLKDKVEANRAIPQRTSAMRTAFRLGGKAGRRHPCDRGCRLSWRPKDKVLHVWWSVGHRSVLHSSTLVCDTGNSIAILSRVRGHGDHEGLH